MNKRSETRLFALLLRDEFVNRKLSFINGGLFAKWNYLDFLKRNADARHSNCYAQALKLIGAA